MDLQGWFDIAEFRDWLNAKPKDVVVGVSSATKGCPVAAFIQETKKVNDVEVGSLMGVDQVVVNGQRIDLDYDQPLDWFIWNFGAYIDDEAVSYWDRTLPDGVTTESKFPDFHSVDVVAEVAQDCCRKTIDAMADEFNELYQVLSVER